MQALRTPEKMATTRPFVKSNSWIVDCFSRGAISRSFERPAAPLTAIPTRQTPTPARTVMRPGFASRFAKSPLTSGGMTVPKAAQNPSATAYPSAIPR